MSKINLSKSIVINAPKEKIKNFLADFNNWRNWSPWLICEPEVKLSFATDGKFYEWEGNRVGSGEMTVIDEGEHNIDFDLTFLKPWKSKAKTFFTFEELDSGTKVTWIMKSSLPFFMFFMKKSMEIYIGMDYERGLKMLKEELEEGEVYSKLDFIGKSTFEGCDYIGIKTDTAFSEIEEVMEKDYTILKNYITDNNIEVVGNPFTEYQKFNLVKDNMIYVAGFPVKEKPNDLPANFIFGSLPKNLVVTVRHTGKYEHLGNAWSTIMMMERNKEFKKNKKAFPLEIYVNDPSETNSKELITDISMPVI